MDRTIIKHIKTSLALTIVAVLVLSCGEPPAAATILDPETTPSMVTYNMTSTESMDGKRVRRIEAPIFEEFDEAAEPFREFKKGIKIETFADDSVTIETDFVADYVRYNKTLKLWEARGNIVARNLKEDQILYTQQLFWDETKKKIYTDKPAKVIDKGSVHYGRGFETDEKFEEYQFTQGRGQVEFEAGKDSTARNGLVVPDSPNVNEQPQDSVVVAKPKVAEIQPKDSVAADINPKK